MKDIFNELADRFNPNNPKTGEYLKEVGEDQRKDQPSTQQESSMPLYKVLDAKRLGGDYIVANMGSTVLRHSGSRYEKVFDVHCKDEITAQYTALAVNNLAQVAEVLERCKEWFYLNAKDKKIPLTGVGAPGFLSDLEEALKAIS